jgi:tRNA pseudouridine38-40 synthase
MSRIAMAVEYDGTAFYGWQIQKDGRDVQSCVERALSVVANEPVKAVCAGRTDSGVHAIGQVIHFDTSARRGERSWVLGVNSNLPDDVNATWARVVAPDFHARFSARRRTYRYLIVNRRVRSSVLRDRACWIHRPLDADLMQRAATYLLGEHDFSSFRAANCQANTATRTIHRLDVVRQHDFIWLTICANAFLQHMVRNIAGALIKVGLAERDPDWVEEVLRQRDRKRAGVTAPPEGLYFTAVAYPPEFGLPETEVVAAVPDSFIMPLPGWT